MDSKQKNKEIQQVDNSFGRQTKKQKRVDNTLVDKQKQKHGGRQLNGRQTNQTPVDNSDGPKTSGHTQNKKNKKKKKTTDYGEGLRKQ